jgi:quinol monooxygenase YgiN
VIIVIGTYEMDPSERERWLAEKMETMRISRGEAGCIDYTFAVDPLEPGRGVLMERWESQAHLDAHLAALRARGGPAPSVSPASTSIVIYESARETRIA